MSTLGIDIETKSSTDIKKSGSYKYSQSPDFKILLCSFSYNNEPVIAFDLTRQKLPFEFLNWLVDPKILKTAYNAQFERICFERHYNVKFPKEQWECTMVKAGMLGLPMNLGACGSVLRITAEKDPAGKRLLRYFTVPCKPTKTNGGRTWNLPEHDPKGWADLIKYNIRDVEAEQEIRNKISFFSIVDNEKRLYILDQTINDRGVSINKFLIHSAIKFDGIAREKLIAKCKKITGVENPNSTAQLKGWLQTEMPLMEIENLQKENLPYLIECAEGFEREEDIKKVLKIREDISKSSIKKYQAMVNCRMTDGKARGLLQFCGANRTFRWAGRLIQVHNLRRIHLKDEDLQLARDLVLADDYDWFELMFPSVTDILSQLIRTAFVPSHGNKFIISDFSAIEARVIAWFAGEQWRLDVFKTHGKIYEASASAMFRINIDEVTTEYRQKGKIAELALGFGGGAGALARMGAIKMGLKETELQPLVNAWRDANKAIVQWWYALNKACIHAVKYKTKTSVRNISFEVKHNVLFINLPSGHALSYMRPLIRDGKFGNDCVCYEGLDQTTKQWKKIDLYGGSISENCVQATARDLLAHKMLLLDKKGYKIAMHVHDEVVIDAPKSYGYDLVNEIMSSPVSWAPGLPLAAKTFESNYYKKD